MLLEKCLTCLWKSLPPSPLLQRGGDAARRIQGFTLIEVLVALAVLAIALTAVLGNISSHVNNAAYLRDRTFAHWVAMNKVAEIHVSGLWPEAGEQKGESLMANKDWFWELKVSNTDDADVRRLDVSVYAGPHSKQPLATLVAYAGRIGSGAVAAGGAR